MNTVTIKFLPNIPVKEAVSSVSLLIDTMGIEEMGVVFTSGGSIIYNYKENDCTEIYTKAMQLLLSGSSITLDVGEIGDSLFYTDRGLSFTKDDFPKVVKACIFSLSKGFCDIQVKFTDYSEEIFLDIPLTLINELK